MKNMMSERMNTRKKGECAAKGKKENIQKDFIKSKPLVGRAGPY